MRQFRCVIHSIFRFRRLSPCRTLCQVLDRGLVLVCVVCRGLESVLGDGDHDGCRGGSSNGSTKDRSNRGTKGCNIRRTIRNKDCASCSMDYANYNMSCTNLQIHNTMGHSIPNCSPKGRSTMDRYNTMQDYVSMDFSTNNCYTPSGSSLARSTSSHLDGMVLPNYIRLL